jgi:molybdate transport system ATP-binding protein
MTLEVNAKLGQGHFTLDARFAAPTNAITALFGPSGSGKSTLLAAIAGLKRLTDGWIVLNRRVCDNVADGVHVRSHERGIGLVFQNARLFPHLTVRQNIAYAQRRAPQPPRHLFSEVAGFFDIENLLDRPITNLSGGERSRVALARALVSEPSLLLLDEPFAALDGTRRNDFIQVLLAMHKTFELPMMVVTHDITDAAALASQVVGLANGRVVASGPFGEIAHQPEFQSLLDPRDVGIAMMPRALRSDREGDAEGLWLRADNVVLAGSRPLSISARNIIEGQIMSIVADERRGVLVKLRTPAGVVLARVTAEAVADLSLAVGKSVWALIKVHSF